MDTLRVPLKPPVLFFFALLTGAALDRFRPWRLLPDAVQVRWGFGGCLFGGSLALGSWALLTLRRHEASPEFGHEVITLVQSGPYRFSRNPLYVALAMVLAGFSLALNSGWVALGVPLLILALDRLVIAREESFLRKKFDSDYEAYSARVRRWL